MIFSPALRPFLELRPEAIDVLEIEPQTLWLADDSIKGPFAEFRPALDLFADLPGHKLVHSVGVPLGGTRKPDPGQLALIRETAARLGSSWVSEHLSIGGTPHRNAGFLLPALQTEEGVQTAAENIRTFAKGVERPVAVETGVAYFRRKDFEMQDGMFLSRVAEEADCGLLLDLHNLYCNHRNGRIDFDRTLAEIPFDRVWEVHLAGGDELDGVWLDSHSGEMPDDLAKRAREVISELPNLGAVNFEIYDSFLDQLDQTAFDRITSGLRDIWEGAGQTRSDARPVDIAPASEASSISPADWEDSVTRAVWKADPSPHVWSEDHTALRLYAFLARSFRGSMLARTMPRSVRYGLLRDGPTFEESLREFFDTVSPKVFAPLEAEAFHTWWMVRGENDPLMLGLMEFDITFVRLLRTETPQIVHFPGDPAPVFEALAEGKLPDCPRPPSWEIEILPDQVFASDFVLSGTGS